MFPYTDPVDEKMILFKPNFKQVSKKVLDFIKLFSKYFSGNFTDSPTFVKALQNGLLHHTYFLLIIEKFLFHPLYQNVEN